MFQVQDSRCRSLGLCLSQLGFILIGRGKIGHICCGGVLAQCRETRMFGLGDKGVGINLSKSWILFLIPRLHMADAHHLGPLVYP